MGELTFRNVGRLLGRRGPRQNVVAVGVAAEGVDDAAVKDLLLDPEGIDGPKVLGCRFEDFLRESMRAVEPR